MAKWINDGLHETSGIIHSFLLAGQSNMAGRGDLTAENALSAPGCLMLRMGRWQPMSEPVNVDRAVLPPDDTGSAAAFVRPTLPKTLPPPAVPSVLPFHTVSVEC